MIPTTYLIGFGAVIGALFRYATNQYVSNLEKIRSFPYGTFLVNVIGSFFLDLVIELTSSETILYIVGTGACGSYTTFSSFSVDTVQLWENDQYLLAGWYAIVNLLGALIAIGFALELPELLF